MHVPMNVVPGRRAATIISLGNGGRSPWPTYEMNYTFVAPFQSCENLTRVTHSRRNLLGSVAYVFPQHIPVVHTCPYTYRQHAAPRDFNKLQKYVSERERSRL